MDERYHKIGQHSRDACIDQEIRQSFRRADNHQHTAGNRYAFQGGFCRCTQGKIPADACFKNKRIHGGKTGCFNQREKAAEVSCENSGRENQFRPALQESLFYRMGRKAFPVRRFILDNTDSNHGCAHQNTRQKRPFEQVVDIHGEDICCTVNDDGQTRRE